MGASHAEACRVDDPEAICVDEAAEAAKGAGMVSGFGGPEPFRQLAGTSGLRLKRPGGGRL